VTNSGSKYRYSGSNYRDPTTGIPDPATVIPDPATGIPDPVTGIPDTVTGIPDPASGIPNPATGIPDPATGITDPATGISDPATGISDPTTGIPDPPLPVLRIPNYRNFGSYFPADLSDERRVGVGRPHVLPPVKLPNIVSIFLANKISSTSKIRKTIEIKKNLFWSMSPSRSAWLWALWRLPRLPAAAVAAEGAEYPAAVAPPTIRMDGSSHTEGITI
jgi:hypothetical protein